MEYLLILLFSFSIRTANIENQHFDYEYIGGIKDKNNRISFLYERENGRKYYGRDILFRYKYFEFNDYVKTAKKINSQKISFLYPKWKYTKIGFSYSLKEWKDSNVLLTALYRRKFCEIRYSRGFGREHIDIDLKKDINITPRLNLVPLISIRKYDDNLFYQFKIIIERVFE